MLDDFESVTSLIFRIFYSSNWHKLTSDSLAGKNGEDFESKTIAVSDVAMNRGACVKLSECFGNWLRSLAPFECILTTTPDEVVILELAERADIITTPEKPAFTMRYQHGACILDVTLVVDESCITIAKTELDALIRYSSSLTD
jgi:hypothetical protein